MMRADTQTSRPTLPEGYLPPSGAFICPFEARHRAAQKGRIRRWILDAGMCGCVAIICFGFLLIGWGLS